MTSDPDKPEVLVLPCSGIGKAFGSISREAAYLVVEELRPGQARPLCLALLTLGDEEAQRQVREHPTITLDGCPKACARVNVEQAGGVPAATFRVFDVFREHKHLKAQGVSELDEAGREMARILAEQVAEAIDRLPGKGGGQDA